MRDNSLEGTQAIEDITKAPKLLLAFAVPWNGTHKNRRCLKVWGAFQSFSDCVCVGSLTSSVRVNRIA